MLELCDQLRQKEFTVRCAACVFENMWRFPDPEWLLIEKYLIDEGLELRVIELSPAGTLHRL